MYTKSRRAPLARVLDVGAKLGSARHSVALIVAVACWRSIFATRCGGLIRAGQHVCEAIGRQIDVLAGARRAHVQSSSQWPGYSHRSLAV